MSKYDLLANPFAVVGVSVGANRASIGETIDDALFEDDSPARQRELDNARQSLFAPRARLEAEIGFLPSSDAETVAEVLASLRKEKSAQSADSLTGIDRVNYLAHRCAAGDAAAKARTAKALAYAYDDVTFDRVISDISTARRKSGFGEVDIEAARLAFNGIRERHADAALDGLLDGPMGPEAVADLAGELTGPASGRREFLALVINQYEVRKGSEIEQAAEDVRAALRNLDGTHIESDLQAFEDSLHSWDRLAQPLQIADSARGIDEPHSRDLFGSIRDHCIDLANNKSQYSLALTISGIGERVFAELPDAATLIDKDIGALEGLLEEERIEAALTPLKSLIDSAGSDLSKLGREVRLSRVSGQGKAIMAALDAALSLGDPEITNVAVAMVRSLAIRLANDANDNTGALAITSSLLKRKDRLSVDAVVQLQNDQNTLDRNIKFSSMLDALKSGNLSQAKSLASDLIDGASDEDRPAIQNVLNHISERQKKTRNGWIWTAAILGGVFVFGVMSEGRNDNNSSYSPSPQYGYASDETGPEDDAINVEAPVERSTEPAVQDAPASTDNDVSSDETPPPPYSAGATFDRSQVRYCMMQKARLEAANNAVSDPTEYQVRRFNSAVDDYNSRCSNFRYRDYDMTAAERDVAQNAARLRSEGEALVNGDN